MNSNEALFSLELAVESLRVNSPTVVCRLPTVAFRLLDFPTLLLHHVDPGGAQDVKEKILLDSFGDVPSQLQELKDHRGNFSINKCKSSLFKMNPEMLLSYLRNTPLYVMLIDVWPEVPKLVANCTVSLQRTMEQISLDIEQNGSDIPSVHGNRDSHKLYNLMGSEVGWIMVRYRLLSMGASLIPHIPQSEITKRGDKRVDLAVTPRKNKDNVINNKETANRETEVVLEDLEVQGHPKSISVAISTVDDLASNLKLEYTEKKQQATQTVKTSRGSGRHKHALDGSILVTRNDDLIVNNTHCPPPLFFNNANEDVPLSSEQYFQKESVSRIYQRFQDPPSNKLEPKMKADLSDDLSTISNQTLSEDIIHQIETHYKFIPEEQSASPSWSVRKTHRTLRREKLQAEKMEKTEERDTEPAHAGGVQEQDVCQRCQLKLDPKQHSQLPILEALLHELSLLHGKSLQNRPATPSRSPVQEPKMQTITSTRITKKQQLEPTNDKQNIRLNPPKVVHQSKPYRHKHRECAKPPQRIPASKAWLRQQQPVQIKRRAKLHFGMTHSQKLRLRKNNPELLKEMEMRELRIQAYREEKEKAMVMNRHARDEQDFTDSELDVRISTEIAHHFDEEDEPGHIKQPQMKCPSDVKAATFKIAAVEQKRKHPDRRNSKISSPEQHPVSALHKPKGTTTVQRAAGLHPEATKGNNEEAAGGGMESDGTDDSDKGYNGTRRPVENQDVSSSEKSARSIDVYLPSASLHESDSGSNSDDSTDTDSQVSLASSSARHPKVIQIPGRPSGKDVSEGGADQADDETNMQYSDDFVDTDNLSSTAEQELAPLASNCSDSYHSAQSSLSDASRSSSMRTTKSQTSQIAVKTPESSSPRPSEKPANSQTRHLSLPKPKLSSISPVPVRKTSKTSTISANTAVVIPDLRKETERSQTPPTPKPRPSLLRTTSSFSETSLLQSTVPSSEFKTEDSLNAGNQEESACSYSDSSYSDHSDTF
ncbi:uncharacterized protein LOC110975158 isoform X2 [Acanthaster planci]|uniref:Uncharacterized protein LOC110975158 isoform X2 n=1 Tax=Acanthaster planci TaxID=133434 RepID=A0A8B7XSZ4_ACAPL|nr:uncharacterized protein LOC110975158 isoform X2 [Acanthaster planci]